MCSTHLSYPAKVWTQFVHGEVGDSAPAHAAPRTSAGDSTSCVMFHKSLAMRSTTSSGSTRGVRRETLLPQTESKHRPEVVHDGAEAAAPRLDASLDVRSPVARAQVSRDGALRRTPRPSLDLCFRAQLRRDGFPF